MDTITTKGLSFIDDKGRERIFNGMNIVDKGTAKLRRTTKFKLKWKPDLMATFRENGFNVVRLGVVWEAIEPSPGCYNDRYLDQILERCNWCAQHGIYFYLDMHQDLYTKHHNLGDGAPKWAVLNNGYPLKKAWLIWADGYFFNKGIQNAFDSFWQNKQVNGKGLQDYYADMWKHVAERVKDHPALLGFDIMNEPYPGTSGGAVFLGICEKGIALLDQKLNRPAEPLALSECFKKGNERINVIKFAKKMASRIGSIDAGKALLQILNTGTAFHKIVTTGNDIIRNFDTNQYAPFLEKVTKAIREVTDRGVVFMENSYYSNLGIPYSAPAPQVNGNQEEKLAFAPHGYDLLVDSPLYKYASKERTDSIFAEHLASQKRLQLPVLVGEWGGFSTGTQYLSHIENLIEIFDQNKWSNTYWCYDKKKLKKTPLLNIISRPYPQAVNSRIHAYQYNRAAEAFTLTYETKQGSDAPTIVYLHKPFKKIKSDCPCQAKKIGHGTSYLLRIPPVAGMHQLKVLF